MGQIRADSMPERRSLVTGSRSAEHAQRPDRLDLGEGLLGRFDNALEESVDDKQGQLIDTLANKYQKNLEAVDARIEEPHLVLVAEHRPDRPFIGAQDI